jgi:hypothetical protein
MLFTVKIAVRGERDRRITISNDKVNMVNTNWGHTPGKVTLHDAQPIEILFFGRYSIGNMTRGTMMSYGPAHELNNYNTLAKICTRYYMAIDTVLYSQVGLNAHSQVRSTSCSKVYSTPCPPIALNSMLPSTLDSAPPRTSSSQAYSTPRPQCQA